MVITKDIAVSKAVDFLDILNRNGIDVSEAYIFGSTIYGRPNADSDIDIAVISKNFSGFRFDDIKKISKFRRKIDLRLEVHPFSYDDIHATPSQFYNEIQKKGIRLK